MDYQEIIKSRIEASNFIRHMGMRITDMSEDYAKGEMELKEEFGNAISSVHGGCIYSLADTVASAAAASHGEYITTVSSDFHFLAPALNCQKLLAEARMFKNGRQIKVCDVEIISDTGKMLAKGTFTFYRLEMENQI